MGGFNLKLLREGKLEMGHSIQIVGTYLTFLPVGPMLE